MEDPLMRWLFDPTTGKVVSTVLGIIVIHFFIRFLQRSLGRYVKDSDTRYRTRKLVSFVGYILAIIYITVVFSDRLGGLTVAFGVAGAGIAFALQEVIASVAGWIAVSFGNFYKTGDRIQLGGIRGDVIDIGVLRTTLMESGDWIKGDNYNGRIVRVSNSFVFKEPVFNYSADFPFLWDEVTLPVKYGSDIPRTKDILLAVLNETVGDYVGFAREKWKDMVEKYRIEAASVEPMVTMTADENWMEFTLRYVVDYKFRRGTKDKIFSRILEEFGKSQGKVSVASTSMDINLTDTPDMSVKLKREMTE